MMKRDSRDPETLGKAILALHIARGGSVTEAADELDARERLGLTSSPRTGGKIGTPQPPSDTAPQERENGRRYLP